MNHTNSWPEHVAFEADCYFHDVLTPRKKMHVEEHCQQCEMCRAALEEARKRFEATKNVAASEPGDALLNKTLTKIAAHEEARRRRFRMMRRASLGAIAAMLLLALGGWIYYLNLGPSPYELRILGPVQLAADSDASLRVWVMHHDKGQGVEKVPVKIELGKTSEVFTELTSFTTDAHGTGDPTFHLPAWHDGDYQLRVTARPGGAPQVLTQNIRLERRWKVMLSSDRPIYKPGQMIHVRSLALAALDLKPAVGQKAVFRLLDPKGNVVFKQTQVASKFGIAAADCLLADEILEGLYTVQCQLGESTKSEMKIQVQKFVLPKFKIMIALDKPYFQPGQRITGKIKADYFFGKPLGEKDGLIEILLGKDAALEKLSLPPGKNGETVFSLPPAPANLLADAAETTLDLAVRVTDSAGQVETRKTPVIVTKEPLRIEVVPEAGSLVCGLLNKIYIQVTSADGKPAKARVMISGLQKELATDERGSAVFEFAPQQESTTWTMQAQDDQGLTGRREVKLSCSHIADDFIVRTDKAVYESGDVISLDWNGFLRDGKSDTVFVEVIKEGQCLTTHAWIPSQEMKIQLAADWFGTLQLRAYRTKGQEIVGARTRVVYVRPPDKVRIATTMDKQEYTPRSQARLEFLLKGPNGNPQPGALSLALVDESVFSVMEQDGSATSYFTSSPQSNSSPGISASVIDGLLEKGLPDDRQNAERALFAKASQEVGKSPRSTTFDASSYAVNFSAARAKQQAFTDLFLEILTLLIVVAVLAGSLALISSGERRSQRTMAAVVLIGFCMVVFVLCTWSGGDLSDLSLRSYFGPTARRMATVVEEADAEKAMPRSKKTFVDGSRQTIVYSTEYANETAISRYKADAKPQPNPIAPPRIRDWFPETLLWRPELITDDHGRANLNLELADSITTWRLSASAVTGDGRLGASQEKIKVFQPFFVEVRLPVVLTRGDEVAVPVVVYSYVDKTQDVALELENADWFTLLDQGQKRVTVGLNDVKATSFRIRASKVGKHFTLLVRASGQGRADAVKREIDVLAEGRAVEKPFNGVLGQRAQLDWELPQDAVPDSARLFLKVYPSALSQVVEGLDSIFRMPSGCFEQTSSSTYPNVLALDYLNRTKQRSPAVEQKAKEYIHLGYQRLVSFEVKGGGFDWFGRPPANRTLTAYGLMEFQDMARVHDVDPKLIERTRDWLLAQRKADGSWEPEGHVPANLPGSHIGGEQLARLSTTAYIAWSIHAAGRGTPSPAGNNAPDAAPTRNFLLQHPANQIDDPHVLGLVCLALIGMDGPASANAAPYLDRLERLAKTTADGKQIFWQQRPGERTTFYGAGRGGEVETTALAALALMEANRSPGTVAAALAWINNQRDAGGTWYSTQATVLALKALLAGNNAGDPNGPERRLHLAFAHGPEETVTIAADQAEVVKLVDLTPHLRKGKTQLTLTDMNGTRPIYQLVLRYHEPAPKQPEKGEPFTVRVDYGERRGVSPTCLVGDLLKVKASVRNEQTEKSPMVMVELPIPPGFDAELDGWAKLVEQQRIAKFQLRAGWIMVYLRDLDAGQTLELPFGLRAKMPARIQVPAARAYEYYNPARAASSAAAMLVID